MEHKNFEKVVGLGYIVIGTKKAKEWETFAVNVLGMPKGERFENGDIAYRMDHRAYRLRIAPKKQEGLVALGLEVRTRACLDIIATFLEEKGLDYERIDGDASWSERAVLGLIKTTDPAGTPIEFFHGPKAYPTGVDCVHGGSFLTGSMGMGHAFFLVENFEDCCRFYEALGFRLSDTMYGGSAVFYHCNGRHHTLGLAAWSKEMGAPKGMDHFMIETERMECVGLAHDKCADGAAPILLGLGQHSNDRMFSFYVTSPSGFSVEIGWGGVIVDDETWRVQETTAEDSWGHRPTGT